MEALLGALASGSTTGGVSGGVGGPSSSSSSAAPYAPSTAAPHQHQQLQQPAEEHYYDSRSAPFPVEVASGAHLLARPLNPTPYDLAFAEPTSVEDPGVQTAASAAAGMGQMAVDLDNQPRLAHPPWPIRPGRAQPPTSAQAQAPPSGGFPPFVPPPLSSAPPAPPAPAAAADPSTSYLLPTAYPTRLPPPTLLLALVETFFDRVPLVSKVLQRGRVMRGLMDGPGGKGWPHVAVLHAICAVSARYSGVIPVAPPSDTAASTTSPPSPSSRPAGWTSTDWSSASLPAWAAGAGCSAPPGEPPAAAPGGKGKKGPRFWGLKDPLDGRSFGARHAAFAKEECEAELGRAERLLDVAVAYVLLANFDFAEARWTQVWLASAAALRLTVPLGLHESAETVVVAGAKPGLLLPTDDAVEREARRRVFWAALMCDRLASVSSGWAQSLEEADVSVELPTSDAEFNRGFHMKENTQTLRSPSLFSSHYPSTTDGYVLVVKATVLLARVKQFNRRTLAGAFGAGAEGGGGGQASLGVKQTAQFRMVQNQVELFRTTLPKAQTAGAGGAETVDTSLVFAHALVFTAAIALHEHHVNLLEYADPSSAYVLAAARAQLSLLFTVFSTSLDVALLPPFIAHCWFVAGRTLCRFFQAATFVRDQFAQKSLWSELEIFRSCLNLMGEKIPVAHRQAALLDQAIQDAVHSAEPMSAFLLCENITAEHEKQRQEQQMNRPYTASSTSSSSAAAPSSSTTGQQHQQHPSSSSFLPPTDDPTRHSSLSSSGGGNGGGGSSSSALPTVSPSSIPGSSFSTAASSPDDYLPRPAHDAPPLELHDQIVETPAGYALLPEFDGADKGLIESLFGPDGMGAFDLSLAGAGGGGAAAADGFEGDVVEGEGFGGPMPFALW